MTMYFIIMMKYQTMTHQAILKWMMKYFIIMMDDFIIIKTLRLITFLIGEIQQSAWYHRNQQEISYLVVWSTPNKKTPKMSNMYFIIMMKYFIIMMKSL